MNNHLSQEQFARYFVGEPTNEERRHVLECAECSRELDRFGDTVLSLRRVVRERVDTHVASRPHEGTPFFTGQLQVGRREIRAALVAAAVILLGIIPLLTSERPQRPVRETSTEQSAEALMNAINLHLSRTVPSPLEPVWSLIPNGQYITQSGGVQ